MKELSIEEKAKAYDVAFKEASVAYKDEDRHLKATLERIFPELVESKDEEIIKEIINIIDSYNVYHLKAAGLPSRIPEYVAWLEKQGEQKPTDIDNKFIRMRETKPKDISEFLDRLTTVEQEFLWEHIEKVKKVDREEREQKPVFEMKTPEESLGIDSDTYNNIVDDCLWGEQKSANKIEPKFKVGQTIKKEGFNLGFTIVKIEDGFYYNDMGNYFPFTDQDNWEFVEQKSEWSEEDEKMRTRCAACLGYHYHDKLITKKEYKEAHNWLGSLKDRVQPQQKQE